MDEEGRRGPGSLLVGLGVAIFAVVVAANIFDLRLGPIASFFEDALLLPIGLIFVGRALNRRAAGRHQTQVPPQPRPPRTARPSGAEFPPLGRTEAPPPQERPQPATTPAPKPKPVVATTPSPPSASRSVPPPPAIAAQSINPHEVHRARSSEDMIAEAKRRLAEKKTQRPNAAS
jgi:hypothetical protein